MRYSKQTVCTTVYTYIYINLLTIMKVFNSVKCWVLMKFRQWFRDCLLEIDENYKIENVINADMKNEHTVLSFGVQENE
jgi:hypothetical protein